MDSNRVSDFIRQYIPAREEKLQKLREAAGENHVPVIRSETEQFLRTLLLLLRPSRILELGTATGYSAILMAHTAEKLETVDTIEDWEPRLSEARINIDEDQSYRRRRAGNNENSYGTV